MTNPRKYVRCKFKEGDARSYTYHWDGEDDFAPGDVVKITDRDGLGMQKVFVVDATDEKPPFPTKPILHRHVEPESEFVDELDALDNADLERSMDMGAR
jgi:hypothetical protein